MDENSRKNSIEIACPKEFLCGQQLIAKQFGDMVNDEGVCTVSLTATVVPRGGQQVTRTANAVSFESNQNRRHESTRRQSGRVPQSDFAVLMALANSTPYVALAGVDELELLPETFGQVFLVQSLSEQHAKGRRLLSLVCDPSICAFECRKKQRHCRVRCSSTLSWLLAKRKTPCLPKVVDSGRFAIDERFGRCRRAFGEFRIADARRRRCNVSVALSSVGRAPKNRQAPDSAVHASGPLHHL